MATPIKETPILTGNDAKRFIQRMSEKREISEGEIARMRRNYELIMSIADFSFHYQLLFLLLNYVFRIYI